MQICASYVRDWGQRILRMISALELNLVAVAAAFAARKAFIDPHRAGRDA
jgi:hypothetical protein